MTTHGPTDGWTQDGRTKPLIELLCVLSLYGAYNSVALIPSANVLAFHNDNLYKIITSKQIKLGSCGWSGFEGLKYSSISSARYDHHISNDL